MNLWDVLETSARRYPDKIAVTGPEAALSYRSLRNRSRALANALYARGLRTGARVAVVANNCTRYLEIIFALMRLGAVCVPVNCRLTAAEIRALIRHAGAEAVFFSRAFADEVAGEPENPSLSVCIDGGSGHAHAYERLCAGPSVRAGDVPPAEHTAASIIYTAGTTGAPKGVVLTHGNHIWNTLNYTAAYGMAPRDVELAPTPLFHASTFGRVFTCVFNGATLVLCSKFDPLVCLDLIQRYRVTSITQTPTMYRRLLEHARATPEAFRHVRRVVTGASPMMPDDRHALQDAFPGAACMDVYGMTEAGPGIAWLGPRDFLRKSSSVGRPMLSVSVAIAGGEELPAAAQSPGEIVCRGPNIMRGYHNNTPDSAAALQGGWLRTGDMGVFDEEGFLHIVGRRKDLIISGGENIYPGEIEAVVTGHPDVAEAAVLGMPDAVWGEAVVAAVVAKPGRTVCVDSVAVFCKQRLASFKCPRRIVLLTALPRSAAGKVLKQQVRAQLLPMNPGGTAHCRPP
jgi:fatty-acyl-CoA synthase